MKWEFEVWSAQCGVRGEKSKVWSGKFKVKSLKCRVCSVKRGMWNDEC